VTGTGPPPALRVVWVQDQVSAGCAPRAPSLASRGPPVRAPSLSSAAHLLHYSSSCLLSSGVESSHKSSQVESSGVMWSRVESSGVEWSRVESSGVEWSRVESSRVESSRVEWSGVESSGCREESSRVEWSGVEWSGVVWSLARLVSSTQIRQRKSSLSCLLAVGSSETVERSEAASPLALPTSIDREQPLQGPHDLKSRRVKSQVMSRAAIIIFA